VSKFQVFVCSDCSGIHRQFGHRVKAVSLSSFTIDEVNALKNGGGNAAFIRTYCAGLPVDFVKPKGTSHDHIKNWIEDVYVLKKFYKNVETIEGSRPPVLDVSPEAVAVVPLSEILGADTPILHVSLDKINDKVPQKDKYISQCAEKMPVENLLGDWDPFEAQVPRSDAVSIERGHHQNESVQEAAPPTDTVETAEENKEGTFEEEWESFMSDSIDPSSEKGQTPMDSHPVEDTWEQKQEQEQREDVLSSVSITAEIIRQEDSKEVEVKKEIPLEAFYPEFEQIRATGILPTGQPVPWMRPRPVEPRPPPQNTQVPVDTPQNNPVQAPLRTAPAVNPTDRAVTALFGSRKNLTAYDLTAPLAAKPANSGNPFA